VEVFEVEEEGLAGDDVISFAFSGGSQEHMVRGRWYRAPLLVRLMPNSARGISLTEVRFNTGDGT
jgi:hypothetical protein